VWGHEYVITSLLERERVLFIGTQFSILYTSMYSPAGANAVSWKIKRGGPHPLGYPQPTSFITTRHVCLGVALDRLCTILEVKSPAPETHCCASHQHGSEQGHGGERQSGTCLFR
jgi:hypothetical protein